MARSSSNPFKMHGNKKAAPLSGMSSAQTQPMKPFGPGAFGPVIAPKANVNAPLGPIRGAKIPVPKLPKITRKAPKPIKLAPKSYL